MQSLANGLNEKLRECVALRGRQMKGRAKPRVDSTHGTTEATLVKGFSACLTPIMLSDTHFRGLG